MKALATYDLRADDYVTDTGPPTSVSSIAHIHKIQNTFFSSAPFSSVTISRSFLEMTARRDLPQNAMFDPDDPAISRFCEAQTFVTVHTTARHYLLSIQSISCLSISRSPNLISPLLHLLLSNCLFHVFNFSDHNMLVRSMHVGHYAVNCSKFLLTLSWAPQVSRDVPVDAVRGRPVDKRNTCMTVCNMCNRGTPCMRVSNIYTRKTPCMRVSNVCIRGTPCMRVRNVCTKGISCMRVSNMCTKTVRFSINYITTPCSCLNVFSALQSCNTVHMILENDRR